MEQPANSGAARPRSQHHVGDRGFAVGTTLLGGGVLLVVGVIVLVCARLSAPAFAKLGFWHFLGGSDWNPVEDSFGAMPFLYGTPGTSAIAVGPGVAGASGLGRFFSGMS